MYGMRHETKMRERKELNLGLATQASVMEADELWKVNLPNHAWGRRVFGRVWSVFNAGCGKS
jgi:hypothetical protein